MPGQRYKESLREAFPEIAKEWEYDLNHPALPEDFSPRSGRVVHWRCEQGHTWPASVAQRTATRSGCPYCSGRRSLPENSLATLEPDIALLWDHESNGDLTPSEVKPGSGRPAHWRCQQGHMWTEPVQAVVKKRGYCAKCNSLTLRYPTIAREWDYQRNQDTPWEVAGASSKKRYWLCGEDPTHSWKASVASRTRLGTGCPQCANVAVSSTNNLHYLAPDLTREYDGAANDVAPHLLVATSIKKVQWVCPKGPDHRWEASPLNRYVNGHGCPYCAGKLPSATNSLASLFPEIAAQFDSDVNGLRPDQVVAGSNRKYQWWCPVASDHLWYASPNSRTGKKKGCPACSRRQASVTNSLESLHPEVAKEMDPDLNGGTRAGDVVAGSNQRLTWRCSVNSEHVWETTPNKRTSSTAPTGCPYCSGLKVLPKDSLAAKWTDIAAEWDVEGNGGRRPDQVAPSSDYRAKWICPNGHRYSARVDHRTRYRSGCGRAACNLAPRSELEVFMAFEITQFFQVDLDDLSIEGPEGGALNVDIKIPKERVAVEFDGTYWHRGKEERDARKTGRLQDSGWQVIRVRDHGLDPIAPSDVQVDTRRMSYKEIANCTLRRVYEVLDRDMTELNDYLTQPDLAMASQAVVYIKLFKERKRQRAQGVQPKTAD